MKFIYKSRSIAAVICMGKIAKVFRVIDQNDSQIRLKDFSIIKIFEN